MRNPKPATAIADRVIRVNGSRAIKDMDLAVLLGISVRELYDQIGYKLWRFPLSFYCKLSDRYDRGRLSRPTRLVFFHGGAIALAGIVCGHVSFQMAVDVAHALRNHRRASARKQRCNKRCDDPAELDLYHQARERLCELTKRCRA
jgi:hypothetical protein